MSKTAKERRDQYYASAKQDSYRARSAYKLLQLDAYLDLLNVDSAVDLCAAPGSWSQVLARRAKRVISVDLAPIAPISSNVTIIYGDITAKSTADYIISLAGGRVALVVCDGAPDVTGLHDLDEYVQASLLDAAFGICSSILETGGNFISKVFRGELLGALMEHLAHSFVRIRVVKPAASRGSSMEAFIVAEGFHALDRSPDGTTALGEIRWEVETCGMDGLDSDKTYE